MKNLAFHCWRSFDYIIDIQLKPGLTMKHEALKFLRNCSPLQDIGDDSEMIMTMLIWITITPLLSQICASDSAKLKPYFCCRTSCLDPNTVGSSNSVGPKSEHTYKRVLKLKFGIIPHKISICLTLSSQMQCLSRLTLIECLHQYCNKSCHDRKAWRLYIKEILLIRMWKKHVSGKIRLTYLFRKSVS